MMRLCLVLILATLVLLPVQPAFASAICNSSGNGPCLESEVGPFMKDISQACGNWGNCTLTDIATVFANVGNWILGIIGALVFLMYVIGGFYFLISGMPGMEKYREKGKGALRISTIGLVIVFVALAGLTTLKVILESGGAALSTEINYVACGPGPINKGESCGQFMQCTEFGTCEPICHIQHPAPTSDEIAAGTAQNWSCVNINNYSGISCEQNKCPGPVNIQCCTGAGI